MKNPTIFDVEKTCGVSRSTISRYLNGKAVREQNKIKIEQAIKDLSFQKNPLASGLKTSKTFTIGCVLPDITDPFFPMIIKSFQAHMFENGYQTIFNTYGNDTRVEIDQIQNLANKRVDGLVVASSSPDPKYIRHCLTQNLPVVLLDRLISGLDCDSVTVDNYQSVYDAISLAIRKGHRKLGYLRGVDLYTDKVRFAGFRDALAKNGVELHEEYVLQGELVEHDAARQFMRLMNLSDPPTLIFCSNVYLAMGALEAMLEYQLDVPEDVSIIAFDRLSTMPYYGFTQCIKPEFSSICQPLEKIGVATAEVLLKRMSLGMEDYQSMNVEIKTSFYITDSVASVT